MPAFQREKAARQRFADGELLRSFDLVRVSRLPSIETFPVGAAAQSL